MSERSEVYQKIKERDLQCEFKWPGFDMEKAKKAIKKFDLFEAEPEAEEELPETEAIEEEIKFIDDEDEEEIPEAEEVTEDEEETPVEEEVDYDKYCDTCGELKDENGGCKDCEAEEEEPEEEDDEEVLFKAVSENKSIEEVKEEIEKDDSDNVEEEVQAEEPEEIPVEKPVVKKKPKNKKKPKRRLNRKKRYFKKKSENPVDIAKKMFM